MIYDCFHFFNELDLLEIRLTELDDVVDFFVIAEATKTMSGLPKELNLLKNQDRFKKWHDKIRYVVVPNMPEGLDHRQRERHQRDAISIGLKGASPGDTIITSDLDEIPNKKAIARWGMGDGPSVFDLDLSYYWVNCVCFKTCKSARIMSYSQLRAISGIAQARVTKMDGIIHKGGWHFSYMGGVEAIQRKLESFCHQELNVEEYRDPAHIKKAIESGIDLFGREKEFRFVPLDERFPVAILQNKEKYAHLIYDIGKQIPRASGL